MTKKERMHIIKKTEFLSRKSGESMKLRLIGADQVDRFIRQGNCVLVDLRRPSDFDKKHLLGAKNIPYNRLEDFIPILQADISCSTLSVMLYSCFCRCF